MTSVSTWFFKKRGLALGVVASGSSLGGVIFPIMVDRLVDNVGFGWTMRAAAFLIFGLLVYANLTVRSRIAPSPRPWSFMEFVVPFRELPFSLTVLAAFLFAFGLFLPFNFIILAAQSYGMSARLAAYLLAVLNGGKFSIQHPLISSLMQPSVSVFGRTVPGFVADKVGRYNIIIAVCYLSGIIVLALWLPARANAPIIIFAAIYGFSSGAFVSLAPACVAQISDIRQIGVRTGAMFAVVSIAALVGNPIGGALISHEEGRFTHLQIFAGVMMLGGSTVFAMARASLVGLTIKKV